MAEVGRCPKCGAYMDDHDGWRSKRGPICPPQKSKGKK